MHHFVFNEKSEKGGDSVLVALLDSLDEIPDRHMCDHQCKTYKQDIPAITLK